MKLPLTYLTLHVILLSALLPRAAWAQKQGNTWYFGNGLGIDFNSGNAEYLGGGNMDAYEGCAAISDAATGEILFYTNGIKVWNAEHDVMPNGTGLSADLSSAQAAVIVPDPGNANQYYIFTAGEYFSGGADGYRYSIVDMNLDGGLGDVTAVKNELLYSPASEKLCVVKNASGTGFWIATHEFSGNNFVTYELTAAGISAPVISSVGTTYSVYEPIGYMKFSSQGNRLGTVLSGFNGVEVFDFDAATGLLSNPVTLSPVGLALPYVYGISFSPNGTRLYATEENDSRIYQFDLAAGSVDEINASKTAVGTSTSYAMQAIQLAPDGKLYVSRNGYSYLAVIEYPDSLGAACGFIDDGFYLGGNYSAYGLPGFPESVLVPDTNEINPVAFAVSDTIVCQKFCVDFSDLSTNNPTAWSWTFEGASPPASDLQNPSQVCYNLPGEYDVSLIACNGTDCDTLVLDNFINVVPTPAAPTITISNDTLFSSEAVAYQWQYDGIDLPGATNAFYVTTGPGGVYTVYVIDSNGCANYSSIKITGVESVPLNMEVNIYSDPANGNILVALHSPPTEILIEVFNQWGQRIEFISSKTMGGNWSGELELNHPSSGVYLVRAITDFGNFNRKILIH
jgi:PKD repeat protein